MYPSFGPTATLSTAWWTRSRHDSSTDADADTRNLRLPCGSGPRVQGKDGAIMAAAGGGGLQVFVAW